MVLHPNQAEVICGCHDGYIRIIDLPLNKVINYAIVLSPCSLRLLSQSELTSAPQRTEGDSDVHLRSVAVSPNGEWLVFSIDTCALFLELSHLLLPLPSPRCLPLFLLKEFSLGESSSRGNWKSSVRLASTRMPFRKYPRTVPQSFAVGSAPMDRTPSCASHFALCLCFLLTPVSLVEC